MNNRIPDYCQYRVGYRAWNVKEPGFLTAAAQDYIWPPKQQYEAEPAPTMDNNGGFWAFLELKQLIDSLYCRRSDRNVFGRVAFWGVVIHHDKGLRAQFAYPLELMHHESTHTRDLELFKRAADRYGIPLRPYQEPPEWTLIREAEMAAASLADQTRYAARVLLLQQRKEEQHKRQLDRNKLQRAHAKAALEYAKANGFKPEEV